MLGNTPNQPTKCKTKNWVKINDDSLGMYNADSQINFKTSMLRSSLFDYGDADIFISETITITGVGADDAAKRLDEINKEVIFKNCAPFTDCKSEINNTQIDNEKYINVIMPMYNSIGYINNYLKKSGSLWQYYREDPNNNIT